MEIFGINQKLVNRKRNDRNYYSFIYSYRQKNQLKHIEKGIGYDILPSYEILDKKKDLFYNKIIEKRFKNDIDRMKSNYEEILVNHPDKMKILLDFGIDFTYDSNRIEGSTLTKNETWLLLKDRRTPKNRDLGDILESFSHLTAYKICLNSNEEISAKLILTLHKMLYSDTKSFAGKFRNETISDYTGKKGVNVSIRGSKVKCPDYKHVKSLMNQLINWYNEKKANYNPVLLACLFKFKFVSIHPFADGNGRVSRLLMNYILHKNRYPMVNIKFTKRKGYYSALERSQLQENEMIFVNWFLKYYVKNEYWEYYTK